MSERLNREAFVWDSHEYPEIGNMLRAAAAAAKRMDAPEEFSAAGARETEVKVESKTPELDIETEWSKQAALLAELFASELDMSRDEYTESLPRFYPQPEAYKGKLDSPLIVPVHPELGIDRTVRIAGITPYYDADGTKDWKDRRHGFTTPQVSYTTWVDDGSRSLGMSVDAVRKNLAIDERGGTVFDGLALYLKNPDILKQYYLDLPGSQTGSDDAPDLRLWYGKPLLDVYWTDGAFPDFGSVRAGREINTQLLTS